MIRSIEQHTYKLEDSLIVAFKFFKKKKKGDHKSNNFFSLELVVADDVESLEDILYDPRDMNVHEVVLPIKGLWINAKVLISFHSSIFNRDP